MDNIANDQTLKTVNQRIQERYNRLFGTNNIEKVYKSFLDQGFSFDILYKTERGLYFIIAIVNNENNI